MNSLHSNHSQRDRSQGRNHDHYEYHEGFDDYEENNDEVIMEADEVLEATGHQEPYYEQEQKPTLYSKTPNIRVSKNLNNPKLAELHKLSPDRLRAENSMPKMDHNPFKNKVKKGYDYYKDSLNKPDFKNNSYGMKGVFTQPSDQFELPLIKEAQGAVIFDRRRLDMLKRDNEDTKSTSNISNTYKQSYRIY